MIWVTGHSIFSGARGAFFQNAWVTGHQIFFGAIGAFFQTDMVDGAFNIFWGNRSIFAE